MDKPSRKSKLLPAWKIILPALLIAISSAMGAAATWSALVGWLPTEEVSIRITDSESPSTINRQVSIPDRTIGSLEASKVKAANSKRSTSFQNSKFSAHAQANNFCK
ncbi:hypothetical protein [Luteolibacter sp. AS25]|uniref:hypothetical protein n=1 Tax=Luteolibacter sp. AS25 TaxID=3135776 RepID=UPI00398A9B2F